MLLSDSEGLVKLWESSGRAGGLPMIIKNSNTDRLIKAVLESSGLSFEFVKLSTINVRPCIACLGCKKDNICKVKDDFPQLAEKVRTAGAVVVGGYSPYGSIDGF